ncbi:MarR family transcriptional regulator [Polaromonas sp.]|uniref:MarR family winged helix-turn-helix transcriptional regulator n=1 Tax=Polaromonas sp. TaxID=1869339 RepID=UPI0017C5BE78|nr:MarR family transcriptional regulator [Polaromonas sp.]NMM08403.1 MarR family transcriptional regulator [Polaromonas sp.]
MLSHLVAKQDSPEPASSITESWQAAHGEPQEAEGGRASSALSTSLKSLLKGGSDKDFRRLIYNLLSLSNVMVRNREHFAAYIGVTNQQYVIMTILYETPGATVSHIANQIHVSSQFITLETGKLIKKGLVDKRPHELDRRSVSLTLTERGQTLLREVWPLRRRTNDLTFQSLTKEQAAILDQIIGSLVMGAQMALHELEAPHRSGRRAPSIERKPKSGLADPSQ